jgi:hypothetical protein
MFYTQNEIIEVIKKAYDTGEFFLHEDYGDTTPDKINKINAVRFGFIANTDIYCTIQDARYYRNKSCPNNTYFLHFNYGEKSIDTILLDMMYINSNKVYDKERKKLYEKNKLLLLNTLKANLDRSKYIVRNINSFKGYHSSPYLNSTSHKFRNHTSLISSDDFIIRTIEDDNMASKYDDVAYGRNAFKYKINTFEDKTTKEISYEHRLHFDSMSDDKQYVLDIDVSKINSILETCIELDKLYQSLRLR